MRLNRLYLLYGLALLGALAWAEHTGWSLASVDETREEPRSVRDNPGSYRAHYRGSGRYFGGK